MAVLPIAEYERLLAKAEDQADLQAALAAERRRDRGEEYLPEVMVDQLIAGESPLRVWRRHRGLTLRSLSEKSGVALSYLSQLENRRREGSARVWRALATSLGVDVDDILPLGTA